MSGFDTCSVSGVYSKPVGRTVCPESPAISISGRSSWRRLSALASSTTTAVSRRSRSGRSGRTRPRGSRGSGQYSCVSVIAPTPVGLPWWPEFLCFRGRIRVEAYVLGWVGAVSDDSGRRRMFVVSRGSMAVSRWSPAA